MYPAAAGMIIDGTIGNTFTRCGVSPALWIPSYGDAFFARGDAVIIDESPDVVHTLHRPGVGFGHHPGPVLIFQ